MGFLLLGVGGSWFRFWVFLFEAGCNVNTSDNSESSEKKKPLEVSQSQILFSCSVQSASSLKENFHISRKINA